MSRVDAALADDKPGRWEGRAADAVVAYPAISGDRHTIASLRIDPA